MHRIRVPILARLLRSTRALAVLTGVGAGVALLLFTAPVSAETELGAEPMQDQGPLVVLPGGSDPLTAPPTAGEPPLTITEPISGLGSVFVVLTDPGATGSGLTAPEASGASGLETLLAGLDVIVGTDAVGPTGSFVAMDSAASLLGG